MAVYDKTATPKKCIKAIAHRGYSTVAPENTLPAYELAVQNGFKYVETDVSLTSDGVPMLLHDDTIDRTSNGSGTLKQMTYEQVRQYDFGSWMSEEYAGTLIPTFAEFLQFCADNSVHPYIELKNTGAYTEAQLQNIVNMVEQYGLKGKVTYISFVSRYLTSIKNYDPEARLGFVWRGEVTDSAISTAQGLLTGQNSVFIDANSRTDASIAACEAANIPLEYWTVTNVTTAGTWNAYISGVTGNSGNPSGLDRYQEAKDTEGSSLREVYDANGSLM